MKRAAILAALLILLGVACSKESESRARARKLIENEQWANARTALGQVLKEEPRDLGARGMLLYALDREDGLESLTALPLHRLYSFGAASLEPAAKDAPKEVRKYVETQLVEARKVLFDRGLDTKDTQDLLAVMVEAARYAYAKDKDDQRRVEAAGVLAMSGDREAIGYLIQQLKGKSPFPAAGHLQNVGAPAVASLQAVLADQGFTGRDPALQVLAGVLASERARALLQEHPELVSVEFSPAPKLEDGLLGSNDLSVRRHLDLWRVHGSLAMFENESGSGADALMLLQAWNDSESRVYLEAHALIGGELQRLALLDKDGKPLALGAEVIHQLEPVRGGVALTRRRKETYRVEVDDGRVQRPSPGARVRLQGHPSRGALVREDQGLWVVKLDEPSQGMTELPVALGSLIAQREEERSELRDEVMLARVESGELRVISAEQRRVPNSSLPR